MRSDQTNQQQQWRADNRDVQWGLDPTIQSLRQSRQSNAIIPYHILNQMKAVIHKETKEIVIENNLKYGALDSKLNQVLQVLRNLSKDTLNNDYLQASSMEGQGSRKEQLGVNLLSTNQQDMSGLPFLKRRSVSVQEGLQPKIAKELVQHKVQQFFRQKWIKGTNQNTSPTKIGTVEQPSRGKEKGQKTAKQADNGKYIKLLLVQQQLAQLKKKQQLKDVSYQQQLRDCRQKHRIQIQKAQQTISKLQMQIKSIKSTHSDKISNIVSNHQQQYQTPFRFIQRQVQQFQNKTIAKIQLLFQSDEFNQNISNYLLDKQSEKLFPFLMLFYSKRSVLFGAYSTHLYRPTEKIDKARGFLFNATKEAAFMAGTRPNNLSSVTLQDNYIFFGNRQVTIENNNLKTVRVCCGVIYGTEYYSVEKRNRLTGQQIEQIQLDSVELHRVYFVE